jgi:hypothetical protein
MEKATIWAFSPDSRSLVVGYGDGAILIHPVR